MTDPKTGTAVVTWDGERKLYPIDLSRDPIAELELWVCEHKDRWARVICDDGYGAGGWGVDLFAGRQVEDIAARECAGTIDETPTVPGFVYVVAEYAEGPELAGLGPTILAAVDHARRIAKGELT